MYVLSGIYVYYLLLVVFSQWKSNQPDNGRDNNTPTDYLLGSTFQNNPSNKHTK